MVIILCPPPKKYLVITFKFIVQMNLFTKRENGKGKWFRHPYVRRNCLKISTESFKILSLCEVLKWKLPSSLAHLESKERM